MTQFIQDAANSLMSPEDLAAMINVRKSTLATWRHKQLGPAYVKLGKKVFYRRADVDQWIVDQVVVKTVAAVTDAGNQLELPIDPRVSVGAAVPA